MKNDALHLSMLQLISPLKRNIFPADPDEAALFFANYMHETAKKCQPFNFRTMAPLCPFLLLAGGKAENVPFLLVFDEFLITTVS